MLMNSDKPKTVLSRFPPLRRILSEPPKSSFRSQSAERPSFHSRTPSNRRCTALQQSFLRPSRSSKRPLRKRHPGHIADGNVCGDTNTDNPSPRENPVWHISPASEKLSLTETLYSNPCASSSKVSLNACAPGNRFRKTPAAPRKNALPTFSKNAEARRRL